MSAAADDPAEDENPLSDDGDELEDDGDEVLSVAIEGEEDALELSAAED